VADFTLNAPGTTNNPWTPANILTPLGSGVGIKSDATGWRAVNSNDGAIWAHNANYGNTITVTVTIAAGGSSNGDQIFMGPTVRSGGNAGGGVGLFLDAFVCAAGWWDVTGTNFTKVTAADTSITRANGDVWSVTCINSGGTWSIGSVTQNGSSITLIGTTTTTQYGAETSIAAGAVDLFGNNNSLYLSQFTGTGVLQGAMTGLAFGAGYALGALTAMSTGPAGISLGCGYSLGTLTGSGALSGRANGEGQLLGSLKQVASLFSALHSPAPGITPDIQTFYVPRQLAQVAPGPLVGGISFSTGYSLAALTGTGALTGQGNAEGYALGLLLSAGGMAGLSFGQGYSYGQLTVGSNVITISGIAYGESYSQGGLTGAGALVGGQNIGQWYNVASGQVFTSRVPFTAVTDVRKNNGYQPWKIHPGDVIG
jgi:hypothetical protein